MLKSFLQRRKRLLRHGALVAVFLAVGAAIVFTRLYPATPIFGASRAAEIHQTISKGFVLDGDSITDGYGMSPNYPDQLAAMTGLRTINLGVSGRMLAEMEATFESRGVADLYDPREFDTLVVLGGANDILHLEEISADGLRRSLSAYCSKAKDAGFRVVVVTVTPIAGLDADRERVRLAHNDWIRANWPVLGDALADAAVAPELSNPADRRYFSDGLHLTSDGLNILATTIGNAAR